MEVDAAVEHMGRWSGWARHKLNELIRTPCFRQCGISHWDTAADHHIHSVQRVEELGATPWDWTGVNPSHKEAERRDDGRLVVFTDGSANNPYHPHSSTRGLWGLYR